MKISKAINVVSLFDGCSGGNQALEMSNIKVNNYFACEIDKFAIKVTQANYPNTIQLGDVTKVDWLSLPKIDLLIGGSPCQSFSFAGKRNGMTTKDNLEILTLEHYLELKEQNFEFEGQSYLFWEFMNALTILKPKYFLLENVEMGEKWEKVLNKAISVKGIHINSRLLTAQNRQRIYWTNIGLEPKGLFGYLESIIQQPKDKKILLKDILESEVNNKFFLSDLRIEYFKRKIQKGFLKKIDSDINGKSECLLATMYKQMQGFCIYDKPIVHNMMPRSSTKGNGGTGHLTRTDGKTYCLDTGQTNAIEYNKKIRRLTPLECERLQGMKDNYTNYVSDSQRYKMIGNGWTIPVISYIFNHIKIN